MPDINVIFHSREEVENLTPDQAKEVMVAAAHNLVNQMEDVLDYGPHFLWSDDGIDYTDAATTHWYMLWQIWMLHDGQPANVELRKAMADYLLTHTEEATDGEFRLGIFSEELVKEVLGEVGK